MYITVTVIKYKEETMLTKNVFKKLVIMLTAVAVMNVWAGFGAWNVYAANDCDPLTTSVSTTTQIDDGTQNVTDGVLEDSTTAVVAQAEFAQSRLAPRLEFGPRGRVAASLEGPRCESITGPA